MVVVVVVVVVVAVVVLVVGSRSRSWRWHHYYYDDCRCYHVVRYKATSCPTPCVPMMIASTPTCSVLSGEGAGWGGDLIIKSHKTSTIRITLRITFRDMDLRSFVSRQNVRKTAAKARSSCRNGMRQPHSSICWCVSELLSNATKTLAKAHAIWLPTEILGRAWNNALVTRSA